MVKKIVESHICLRGVKEKCSKALLHLLLVFIISLLIFGCGTREGGQGQVDQITTNGKSVLEKVKREKVLKVGYVKYPPYVIRNPNTGALSGFYIELIEYVAKLTGAKVSYHESNWGTMITDIKAHKYDVQAAPIFRTTPRAMEVSFLRPIGYFGNGAVVRKGDTRFKNPLDFNREGVKIAVAQGEVGHEFAKKFLTKTKLIVIQTEDIARPLLDVVTGRADAGIADAWTTYRFVQQHPDAVEDLFAEKPFNIVSASWFVRQGDPVWEQFLNTAIDFLESSGEIERLSQKYQVPSFREKKIWTRGLLRQD